MIDNGFVVVQPLHLHKVSYEINICYALKISHISVTSTSQLLSADFPGGQGGIMFLLAQ